ncbi:MAG TPA: glycoside hydrolase family 16 protein [Propionibacteriaceae bacterium]|nr:glycoside hydrolase family 16 protein [Propionibacteriaceae bacterium]
MARISVVGLAVMLLTAMAHITFVEGDRASKSREGLLNEVAKAEFSPTPRGAAGKWKLHFSDEFTGNRLDLDKWRPNWRSNVDSGITPPVNTAERSCYDPRQVTVSGGALNLTASRRSCRLQDGTTYAYASGLVESSHDYEFTYGFTEARMYLPPNKDKTKGPIGSCGPNWAAFWINGYDATVSEIDVMECLDHSVGWTYHWDGYKQKASSVPSRWRQAMPPATGGWHTFGVNWQPNLLEFYYDGVKVGSRTKAVPKDPHFLIANLAVTGSKPTVPQTLKVDYIRVWK